MGIAYCLLIVFYFSYTRFSEKQKYRKQIKELEKDIQRIDNERLKSATIIYKYYQKYKRNKMK